MTDVVISGRIQLSLMDQLKKLGKTNTEILNEALKLYIEKINDNNQCIQGVYNKKHISEYNLLCQTLDNLTKQYTRSFKELEKKEVKERVENHG